MTLDDFLAVLNVVGFIVMVVLPVLCLIALIEMHKIGTNPIHMFIEALDLIADDFEDYAEGLQETKRKREGIDQVDYSIDYWLDEHICADGEVLPIIDDAGPHIVMPVYIIEPVKR